MIQISSLTKIVISWMRDFEWYLMECARDAKQTEKAQSELRDFAGLVRATRETVEKWAREDKIDGRPVDDQPSKPVE